LKLAAIDIGSNSIKLVVVDAAASNSFAVLVREREVVRLGHDTLVKGYLSQAATLRAINCIKRFRLIAEARGAEKIIIIATASVREASNSANFIKSVERRTGLHVEVLSGIEEARLIGLAASQACGNRASIHLNIDIGGGSTELSIFRKGTPLRLMSLKLGAVGLSERFIATDPPRKKELAELRNEIRAAFQRPSRELRSTKWKSVTGTSGTILALGALIIRRSASTNKTIDVSQPVVTEIRFNRLAKINSKMAGISSRARRSMGLTEQRAEIIVAGGQILEGAMTALEIGSIETCDWALREGVIIDALREWEDLKRPPLPDNADPKLLGVHAVGKRFGYEEAHAHQVARIAERIFDSISANQGLTRHQRLLLSAAALLHDVGYHIAHESHHKHSYYLIENSELTGFSEIERSLIANIARYHKGSGPKERHPNFGALNENYQETVLKLASILRLADALDRRHDSRVDEVNCRRMGDVLSVRLASSRECDDEITEAKRRLDLFEDSFQMAVRLSVRSTPPRRRVVKKTRVRRTSR